jgi:hypothetical protein
VETRSTEPIQRFICSVGVGNYSETVYTLEGREFRTRFAPVAVAHLRKLQGARATVVGTQKAIDRWYTDMAAELRSAGVDPSSVIVPDGRHEEELMDILDALANIVKEGESVTLDVTFALRHLSFAYFAALTYLTALRGVRIDGLFYGAFELRDKPTDATQILDLTPLIRVVRWYHAVQTASESGDLRPMAKELRGDAARLFRSGAGDRNLSAVPGQLDKLSRSLATGLPIETGVHARGVITDLERLPPGAQAGRMVRSARLALDGWKAQIEGLAVPSLIRAKKHLVLTEGELDRQLTVAGWYLERTDLLRAQLLLREWLISLVLLRSGMYEGWLVRSKRLRAERCLNGLADRAQYGLATPEEKPLASLWRSLADRRNPLAHCGMTEENVRVHAEGTLRRLEECRSLLKADLSRVLKPVLSADRGPTLVTPFGFSPGVLFTAVRSLAPEQAIIVSSTEASSRVGEALTAAGQPELRHRVLLLKDALRGFGEVKGLIDKELRAVLISSREVVVNITGGSTCLQYVVAAIGREASRLGVPVRTVALVDARSLDEQRANPYVLGHVEPLDAGDSEERPDVGDEY